MTCPKCAAAMEPGFIVDTADGTKLPPVWYSGKLELSFWTGLRLRNRVRRYVQSIRCTKCGYLESYAL